MKIAIVDDDEIFLKNLVDQVASYPNWEDELPLILPFSSALKFLNHFEADPVDIVILDVVMPGLSGVEAARRIYELNPNVVLAFVSSSPDHAVAGYGVDAVAYILKPARREAVHALVREAVSRRTRRHRNHISLKTGRTTSKINPDEVVYLESNNKKVIFHGRNAVSEFPGKLDDFLTRMPPDFVQVHKSYAVNLNHIRAMRPQEMITDDGRSVPISRRFRLSTEKLYLAHVAEEL